MLGIRPLVGRAFTAAEILPPGRRVVLLGHDLWRQRFGGDPAGGARAAAQRRALRGGRRPPRRLPRPHRPGRAVGAHRPRRRPPRQALFEMRKLRWLNVVSRLRPGVARARRAGATWPPSPRPGARIPHRAEGIGDRLNRALGDLVGDVGRTLSRSSPPSPSSSSSPAPTWRMCCSRGRRSASARWRSARRSAPAAGACCASCSPSPRCWRRRRRARPRSRALDRPPADRGERPPPDELRRPRPQPAGGRRGARPDPALRGGIRPAAGPLPLAHPRPRSAQGPGALLLGRAGTPALPRAPWWSPRSPSPWSCCSATG